jgi:hypothetical protein
MIKKLILKDFKTHQKTLLLLLFAQMLAGGLFIFRFYPWNVYTMYGFMVICFASSFIYFTEKKRSTEILNCSLPVTRTMIVAARYLFSVVIAGIGMMLWIFNAYIFEQIYPHARTDFAQIYFIKVLVMALFFLSVHLSLFLPAVFRFNLFSSILTFVIALTVAVASIPTLFYPYKRSYNPYFEAGDAGLIAILTLIIILAPLLSAMLSISLYNKKDI